ncbi:MAG: hypothetical protein A2655_01745 [Candidatus Yanofskybacteria bacterium RIFCSPHIGHO2_01_FULL_43_42]|uniref:SET domain-containing protein n=1 Tax=Candidatus Yanofskybacteria bacterium RIFCSPLOWO2_01_FULL_43_22 TaxID=1802695 RepID=A0A1F8GGT4_9BACT|nr:MAG: hypothetical protein A2655_01745 [Candidatus Yanofskybacteria bacterium RIFCSPHIGHO2_01_FULL_43_42]OGN13200.1 MAG: hypothetical protein A3D48_02650 [Candidatus Yanofskybacteria bacterium RIFCSPHIGHO2_02_FULL_43_17]OGN24615.1 MAG: hypothetical protein A3A13_00875 [Candidatus Yanofskybacteria bacterium RIFCSPLOWO2_01_FULL_43_22]
MAKRQEPLFPHEDVYVRLMSSRIHGIGCFAIRDIPAGTNPFEHSSGKMIWIGRNFIEGRTLELKLPRELKKLYRDFCVRRGDNYGCPENFNQLDVSWYLNHSKKPNMVCKVERGVYNFMPQET